jgi:cob(I)alamin adenosyltransferase
MSKKFNAKRAAEKAAKREQVNLRVDDAMNNLLDNLKVVKADTNDVKKFITEICGVSDIKDKVIVVKVKYPIEQEELAQINRSLFAINEVLAVNNSTFIVLPETDRIAEVAVETIDTVIDGLQKLKEKIDK